MKNKLIIGTLIGISFLLGMKSCAKYWKEQLQKVRELNQKDNAILGLYCHWMKMKESGKTVSHYLEKNDYKSVAVYGMHYLGENLVEELQKTGIHVKYVIDKNADAIYCDEIDVFSPEADLEEVDAILVTAFYYFDEIEKMLSEKVHCPILSIEDIIYSL